MTQRPEELGQQLRQLHAQISGTKYSTMMKLLRLTLSGLQASLPPSRSGLGLGELRSPAPPRAVTTTSLSGRAQRCRDDDPVGTQGDQSSHSGGSVQPTRSMRERDKGRTSKHGGAWENISQAWGQRTENVFWC